jgi:hypothetical protein
LLHPWRQLSQPQSVQPLPAPARLRQEVEQQAVRPAEQAVLVVEGLLAA